MKDNAVKYLRKNLEFSIQRKPLKNIEHTLIKSVSRSTDVIPNFYGARWNVELNYPHTVIIEE